MKSENSWTNFEKATRFDNIKGNICYPFTEFREESGYKWYVANHRAYQRKGNSEIVGVPKSRNQMVFMQYMEAMTPALKGTALELDAALERFNNDQKNKNNNANKNCGNKDCGGKNCGNNHSYNNGGNND